MVQDAIRSRHLDGMFTSPEVTLGQNVKKTRTGKRNLNQSWAKSDPHEIYQWYGIQPHKGCCINENPNLLNLSNYLNLHIICTYLNTSSYESHMLPLFKLQCNFIDNMLFHKLKNLTFSSVTVLGTDPTNSLAKLPPSNRS